MGKVSTYLIVIGLVFLVPAIVLTIFSAVPQVFAPNDSDWFNGWVVRFVTAFVTGLFYAVAFGFIVLGVLVIKRDAE